MPDALHDTDGRVIAPLWRVLPLSGSGIQINELCLYETINGLTKATGSGTAIQGGGTNPADAFDGNDSGTRWNSPGSPGPTNWLGYDFGASFKKIRAVSIFPVAGQLNSFKMQAALTSGGTWIDVGPDCHLDTYPGWVFDEYRFVIQPGGKYERPGHRYWRVGAKNGAGDSISFYEVDLRESGGSTTVIAGARQKSTPVYVDSIFSPGQFAHEWHFAVDGDFTSAWSSGNFATTDERWVSFDLGQNYDIRQAIIKASPLAYLRIYYSDDGVHWHTAMSVTDPAVINTSGAGTQATSGATFTVPATPRLRRRPLYLSA